MQPTRHEFLFMDGPLAKAAFYALMFLALGICFAQFIVRARLWKKGRPVTWKQDWLRSVWETVLAQRKVLASRPRSGAPMHFLIFYGFLSLLLATTLLGIATYSPLVGLPNFHVGRYYLTYETTFDILGLMFIAGALWALVRRSRTREPITRERSDEFALCLLLSLGLTGYLLEGLRIAADPKPWDLASPVGYAVSKLLTGATPASYIAVWWFHAVLVAIFIAVLPRIRLRHIVNATLTAAGAPDRTVGKLVPLKLAEVEETGLIGAAFATDLSRWHLMSLDACMSCGRCTEVCPAHGVGKVLNPKQVVADTLTSLESGSGLATTLTEEALWACTTCNACVEACPVMIRHVDVIVDARRNLVAEGKLSGSGATMLRQVGSTGHAWGAQPDTREDWMKGLDVPLARDGKSFDVLLWVGCAGATDPGAIKTTRAVAELLGNAGVSYACLGAEETCTGDSARRVGDEFTFQALAEGNIETFKRYGVNKIVTPCPHCMNTLKNEYQDFGADLEVQHHTELLATLVEEGKLKAADPEKDSLTYHDPCYLARVNGIADAPRALVGEPRRLDRSGSAARHALETGPVSPQVLAEPEQHGRNTLCCGAGGGRMWMEDEPGKRPSDRRVRQLLDTGAKTVAVSCPFCRIMLDTGIQAAEEPPRLVDMAELLRDANK